MIKLKDYNWALEGLASLILLIAFVMMLINLNDVGVLIIRVTGLGVLFFTLIRIKPILASRNEKDYVIVMFSELIIDLAVGCLLLFASDTVNGHDIIGFGRLLGLVLFVRGVSHFWTTAKRYELHDIISFVMHVIFISVGAVFLYIQDKSLNDKVVILLLILSILLSMYFGYRTYKGYNHYRIQKTNALKMGDYLEKKEEEVIEDPKSIEEKINPKTIDEPKKEKKIEEPNDDNRPSIDIN